MHLFHRLHKLIYDGTYIQSLNYMIYNIYQAIPRINSSSPRGNS